MFTWDLTGNHYTFMALGLEQTKLPLSTENSTLCCCTLNVLLHAWKYSLVSLCAFAFPVSFCLSAIACKVSPPPSSAFLWRTALIMLLPSVLQLLWRNGWLPKNPQGIGLPSIIKSRPASMCLWPFRYRYICLYSLCAKANLQAFLQFGSSLL